jgi:hypothetical protein
VLVTLAADGDVRNDSLMSLSSSDFLGAYTWMIMMMMLLPAGSYGGGVGGGDLRGL